MKVGRGLGRLTILFIMAVCAAIHVVEGGQDDILDPAWRRSADNAVFQAESPDAGPEVDAPVLNVGEVEYFLESSLVTASCETAGATLRYTTDGSEPTDASPLFPAAGLTITEDSLLMVRAFKTGMQSSETAVCRFVLVHETTAEEYRYTIQNNKVTINGYIGDLTSIVIPATIEGKPVGSIGNGAFANNENLTAVVIPSGVTSIGDHAFYYCSGLISISIPFGVTSIGRYAFQGCYSLASLLIPASVTSIGNDAFVWCTSLTSVSIPSSVTSIGNYAFQGCYGLTSVSIPSSVTSIGNGVFEGCQSLTSVSIPFGVTSIGRIAFSNCIGLTSVSISSSVTSIEDDAFVNCISLTSYSVDEANAAYTSIDGVIYSKSKDLICFYPPAKDGNQYSILSSVTSIGNYAFSYCTGLTFVSIPSGVTTIGNRAFEDCNGLTSVSIPSNVTSIGESAFAGCSGLTSSLVIPPSVTSIGASAFSYCSGLTSVSIPSSVTSIENGVFLNCSGLTSLVIPSSVTSIGDRAFFWCDGLRSVSIPSSVTSIGDWAFYGCNGLTSLVIPSGVTSIGKNAFQNCDGLTSVSIPSSVTSIGDDAFSGCRVLATVSIPFGVTSIGKNAFSDCYGLKSVSIPSSVTSIGGGAFSHCNNLTSVSIPSSVTSIGVGTFSSCIGLTTVSIPSSVTSIGESAFSHCSGLTSVSIPSSVISIGGYAFSYCTGLTSVSIPSNVTSIGDYAFLYCSGLMSVSISSSVTSIGFSAFYGCSGLTSVVIPASVTTIKNYAFSRCSRLTEISFDGTCPVMGAAALASPLTCHVWPGMGWENAVLPDGVTISIRDGVNPPMISQSNGEEGHFTGSTTITMTYEGNTDGLELRYTLDGTAPTVDSPQYTQPFEISETCTVAARCFRNGEQYSSVSSMEFVKEYGFDEIFADSGLAFENEADYPWTATMDSTIEGGLAARSGAIGHSQETSIQTNVNGKGHVSFLWKVSSEQSYDKLHFYVDDSEVVTAISGMVDWTQVTVNIDDAGEHILKWTYEKNSSGTNGSDCGWVADVVWEPQGNELVSIAITGNATIATASTETYACIATWSDGTTTTVTQDAVWSLDSETYASVDAGLVTNQNTTTTDQTATLTASYTAGDVTKTATKTITLEVAEETAATQILALEPGWNWVSFNILPESCKVGDVLGTAGFTMNDVIQTNGGMARFTGSSWVQGSFTVEFGKLYQIYVDRAVTVTVSGDACGTCSVPLVAGWNWIGNPTAQAVTPADLAHSGGWAAGDRIQSPDGGVTYTGGKWVPAGFTLEPGKGCQIFTANAGTLSFPSEGGEGDALYVVVDLSGGPDAASYPVRYSAIGPDLNDDTCRTTELWLRKISAGTFIMGSPEDEMGRYGDETEHEVTLTQDYYIGVFECTQRQWELVMGTKPSYFNNADYYATRPVEQVSYDMIRGMSATAGAGWPAYGRAVDATSFMGKLREKTGLTFDLPTGAQWEYACRAGTTTAFNSGKNLTARYEDAAMDEVGRYMYNGGLVSLQNCTTDNGTAKVGSYLPNAWGLYDMHGNVWEWCLDWYKSYEAIAVSDPLGPTSGSFRVLRGGEWDGFAAYCRSAYQGANSPSSNGSAFGFRVLCLP